MKDIRVGDLVKVIGGPAFVPVPRAKQVRGRVIELTTVNGTGDAVVLVEVNKGAAPWAFHLEHVELLGKHAKSYAPEVIADESGKWCGNNLRFPTREEAEANVHDLMMRWMLVRETRVVESDDEPNYRWENGRPVRIEKEEK
jgi:hypothetical protein